MRPSTRSLSLVLGCVLLTVCASPALCREPGLEPASVGSDANWIASQFYPVGADHEVMSAFVHDGDLVISGNFGSVADVAASGVARWDGAAWSAYPGTEWGGLLTELGGMLTVVRAYPLASDPSYTQFDVLSWNGSGWDASPPIFEFTGNSVLGTVDRTAGGVAVLDGNLYVTPIPNPGAHWFEAIEGSFPGIARWDGSAWHPFGGADGYVALETWNGQLIASGFEHATYHAFIDRWDGTSWTRDWSSSTGDVVTDFAPHGGQLAAARIGNGLLLYDGSSWTDYADPITATVLASTGSDLAAATGADVQKWDGSLWSMLGSLEGSANALAAYGGGLAAAGALPGNVSLFDGTSWETPGKKTGRGLAGDVEALASYGGKLYVAGRVSYPGSGGQAMVAAWDGASWETVLGESGSRKGRTMTLYDGKLVVGGSADYASVSPPNQIGTWDGAVWTTLGTSPNWFQCLAVYNGNLIAGGMFTAIDAVSAAHLASFDGLAWSELGGVSGPLSASNPVTVSALAVWNGLLVVGGTFDTVDGTPFDYIASWNGSQWRDLEPNGNNPPVVTGPIKALAVYNGTLVASGSFWGTDVIAYWDGHDWSPMGSGLNVAPKALAVYGGYLLASGEGLSLAGGVPVNGIAAWDGVSWDALGSGLEYPRPAAESPGWAFAEHQGVLYVGGNFRSAGGKAAEHLAMWASPAALAVVPDGPARPAFSVKPGLPNPCRSSTRIALEMPRAGHVTAAVFDAAGRKLGTIFDRDLPTGPASITWSPRAMGTGTAVPAGAYFIRVSALGASRSQKVVYLP